MERLSRPKVLTKEKKMRTSIKLVSIFRRAAAIGLATLFSVSNLNFIYASSPALPFRTVSSFAAVPHDETGPVHRPLATAGVTLGQTARISVVNSPDPNSSNPPEPVTVEMCFHDSSGGLILDRSRRPVQKTATIDPHHGDFLDLNGNLVAAPGARVVIIPCVRVLRISDGTLVIPTIELYNNLLKTTFVLSPGIARGFDPQPDPPASPEVAFGLVGITQGVTARLYVVNAENPNGNNPPEPVTVELEFHDAGGNVFLDRAGREARQIVTVNPNQAGFLELNGNDLATLGARVGIIPCVKVLRGSASSRVVPTFEMYVNFTQQTLLLSNFVSDPHSPITPAAVTKDENR
jgi:hypothetical protein